MISIFRSLCVVAVLLRAVSCDGHECEGKLEEAGIIQEFADRGTPGDLNVVYKHNISVECGRQISIMKTIVSPVVTYDVEDRCNWTSIVMFDPDLPIFPSFLHWFVSDIPNRVLRSGFNRQNGTTVAEYIPPATATGKSRYTFCLYCQERRISPERIWLPERINFNPRELADRMPFGNPVACNFMYVVLVPDLLPTVKTPDLGVL